MLKRLLTALGGKRSPWKLRNCEKEHAKDPLRFALLPRSEREALEEGSYVKLHFELLEPTAKTPAAERMFVQVAGRDAKGRYKGVLDNDPRYVAAEAGDVVTFGPEHVAQLLVTDPADPRFLDGSLMAWVSPAIAEDGVVPDVVSRIPPCEEIPSGWLACVYTDGTRTKLVEEGVAMPLGALLDKWGSLEQVATLPEGFLITWDRERKVWTTDGSRALRKRLGL